MTNGTWTLRVKIFDPDKVIPSYIHRRDEGELWSLNFEGRVFCCWKCGSGNHIGDKCRDHTRTFDEVFQGNDVDNGNFEKPTWAAVVRSGQADSDEQIKKVKEMERKLREENQRKDQEKRDIDEKKRIDDFEAERQKQIEADTRKKALDAAAIKAKEVMKVAAAAVAQQDSEQEVEDDSLFLKAAENIGQGIDEDNTVSLVADQYDGDRARLVAIKHRDWLETRQDWKRFKNNSTSRAGEDIWSWGYKACPCLSDGWASWTCCRE